MRPRFLILVAALALTVGQAASASDEAGGGLPPQVMLEEMSSRLGLTADQQARIEPLLTERNEKLKALAGRLDGDASRRDKLKVAREAREIQQDFVSAVTPELTKEQHAAWRKMRDETRDQLAERRQRRQR